MRIIPIIPFVFLALSMQALAQSGEYKISQINASAWTLVTTLNGQFRTFKVRPSVEVTINGAKATFAELAPGMDVKVTSAEPGVATRIAATSVPEGAFVDKAKSAASKHEAMEKGISLLQTAKEVLKPQSGGGSPKVSEALRLAESARDSIKKGPAIYLGHRQKALDILELAIAELRTDDRAKKAANYIDKTMAELHDAIRAAK